MYKFLLVIPMFFIACKFDNGGSEQSRTFESERLIMYDKSDVISKADAILLQGPTPLSMFVAERSKGGIHDFFSEGDYWWPDPDNPDGPYIRRDGQSNPENFLDHRIAMRNLNEWVSTLVAAYSVTSDTKYANHAMKHLEAFFLDPETMMNPSLLYAQAIQGRHTGRGIGIIDTIHLIEVARSILRLFDLGHISENEILPYRKWFDQYATWMNTHQYGVDEKYHGNNHSTWWAAQIAAFAEIAQRDDLRSVAVERFKSLLDSQMAEDGSFPDEMERTKPYNYSLFNLEAYAVLCHLASSKEENLWTYEGSKGSVRKAFDFMIPYIKNKDTWPKAPDVQHFDEIPIKSIGLFLAAEAYKEDEIKKVFSDLSPEKKSEEVKRTFPLWYAINWQ